jgi:hypothetical protein
MAELFTPALLEPGGPYPAVVDETANLPNAAKKLSGMPWRGEDKARFADYSQITASM